MSNKSTIAVESFINTNIRIPILILKDLDLKEESVVKFCANLADLHFGTVCYPPNHKHYQYKNRDGVVYLANALMSATDNEEYVSKILSNKFGEVGYLYDSKNANLVKALGDYKHEDVDVGDVEFNEFAKKHLNNGIEKFKIHCEAVIVELNPTIISVCKNSNIELMKECTINALSSTLMNYARDNKNKDIMYVFNSQLFDLDLVSDYVVKYFNLISLYSLLPYEIESSNKEKTKAFRIMLGK